MITAAYTDLTGLYNDATLALTQQVEIADTTAPVITPHIQGMLGQKGWYTSDVNLTWDVTDPESAITSSTGCDLVTINSDQAETAHTCEATSAGGTSSETVNLKRDATQPVATVTGVTEGSIYILGGLPAPQPGCSTTDAMSGVATEATLALSGADAQSLGDITATCSGALDNAGNAGDPASVHYSVVLAADLSINKTDSKDPVKPGANLVYTLTVSNAGPHTAGSVTVVDTLDRNTTYVSVSAPKGWTCKYANYAVTCTSTSLTSGSSAIIKITVTVNKTAKVGKELVNNAEVSSATYDPATTNNNVVQKTLVAK